jgi:endoglucanase
VVGADLRNEPRNDTKLGLRSIWGGQGTPDFENWQQAATQAGNQLLAANPNLLIMVEGVNYSVYLGGFDDNTDLPANPSNGGRGVAGYPVQLSVPHQMVYAPHNYSWDNGTKVDGGTEGYGLLNSAYTGEALPALTQSLRAIAN